MELEESFYEGPSNACGVNLMRPHLFTPGPASDPMFLRCRDEEYLKVCRVFIEAMWERYNTYCPDKHFATEIRHQFHQRTWEMYLACELLDSGLKLRKASSKGPDLCIDEDPPIWIEAVSVECGDGPDRVHTDEERRDSSIPQEDGIMIINPPSEESILLRFNQALIAKSEKITEWRKSGFLGKQDPCLVAICLGKVESADFFDYRPMPLYLKALFGFGDLFYNPSLSEAKFGYLPRPSIQKASGSKVSNRTFIDKEICEVSGVVFSSKNVLNIINKKPSDLVVVHNPTTLYPFKSSFLRIGKEWVVESMRLKCIENI